MDPAIRLLQDLVAIPSVNPMGRPLDVSIHLETRMGDYLERFFRELDISYYRDPVAPGRDNLIATYQSSAKNSPTILYDAHQDTVPVDGMTIEPFRPDVVGGKLFGRGSCDVKGGMAAMLAAFARLVREKPRGAANVVLACTVDEEYTHIGSSRLAERGPRADLAVVAEPTRLDLVVAHKGAVRWKIQSQGTACHSSTPNQGDNAIYRMARVVSTLQDYAEVLAAQTPHPLLGPPSLSVGRIEGGQSVNVVPDWCVIEVDRRVIPGEVVGDVPQKTAEYLAEKLGNLDRLEFLPPWVRMPSLAGNVEPEMLDLLERTIQHTRGKVPERLGVPYGTDAGPLAESGIPCVVFGPGDIAQAHTKEEWIALDQVPMAAEIYYQMAVGFTR